MLYCSYEITPKRVHMKSDSNNYNIDDLNSEDSTDEDDRPRKPIPLWASGMFLMILFLRHPTFDNSRTKNPDGQNLCSIAPLRPPPWTKYNNYIILLSKPLITKWIVINYMIAARLILLNMIFFVYRLPLQDILDQSVL